MVPPGAGCACVAPPGLMVPPGACAVPALLPSVPPGVCASANDVPQIKAATAAVANNLFLISRLLLSLCPSLLN